jgi:hypothetical protein
MPGDIQAMVEQWEEVAVCKENGGNCVENLLEI